MLCELEAMFMPNRNGVPAKIKTITFLTQTERVRATANAMAEQLTLSEWIRQQVVLALDGRTLGELSQIAKPALPDAKSLLSDFQFGSLDELEK